MAINCIKIDHFRNIDQISINLCAHFNLFYGNNGSGKTSLLEAIYYLSTNRSFRTHLNQRIIQFDHNDFVLYAELHDEQSIGIQKSLNDGAKIKLSGEYLKQAAELARQLPMVLLNYDSFDIFTGGSEKRRQLMDWLMFHVEPNFSKYWQRYYRALKQRNLALKQRLSRDEIEIWNHDLIEMAKNVHELRQKHIETYFNKTLEIARGLLPHLPLNISYQSGFKTNEPFDETLKAQFIEDCRRGYTRYGIHRADLEFKTDNGLVRDVFSRGQQKALLLAACLGQIAAYSALSEEPRSTVVLIDDIAAELDKGVLSRVIETLENFKSQVLMTSIHQYDIDLSIFHKKPMMFHVEQGAVRLE